MLTVTIVAAYVRRYLLRWMGGRSLLITSVANQALPALIGFAVWWNVFGGSPWITRYYAFLIIVQVVTASYENYIFSIRIYDGSIVDDLLAPHPTVLIPIANSLAMRAWQILFGFPLIAVVIVSAQPQWSLNDVMLGILAMILAAVLSFLFSYAVALLGFWTERVHGLDSFSNALLFFFGGASAPVSVFPHDLEIVANVLPFRSMLGFPAELASGSQDASDVQIGFIIQALWIAVFVALCWLLWKHGVRRYTSVGG